MSSYYITRREPHMIIELNTSSDIPIYVQLRNQIVLGIGRRAEGGREPADGQTDG